MATREEKRQAKVDEVLSFLGKIKKFNEGDIVRIYQHSYIRLLTFDKNGELYVVHQNQIN